MDEQNNQVPPSTPEPEVQKEEPQIIEEKQPETPITPSSNEDNGKLCAILAYLLIGIIWYFADDKMKKNTFVKFHVKQSLVLLIASIILQVIGSVLPAIIGFMILSLSGIFSLVWMVIGIVNAINGKEESLPIIGQYSSKFNF